MTYYILDTMKVQVIVELCLPVFKTIKLSMAIIIVLYIIHIARSYVRYFNKLESARALKKEVLL